MIDIGIETYTLEIILIILCLKVDVNSSYI